MANKGMAESRNGMESSETALRTRINRLSFTSAAGGRPTVSGKTIRQNKKTKNSRNAMKMAMPHHASGRRVTASFTAGVSGADAADAWSPEPAAAPFNSTRNMGSRLKNRAMSTPATAPQELQSKEGPTMAVGLADLLATMMA